MRHYELVVVLSPMISPDEAGQAWERIKGFITNREAEIVHEERWGTRRLAYPVKKGQYQFLEGNYHLTRFATEQSFNRELENYLKLDDQVLRSLVTATLTEEELAAHAAQTRAPRPPRPPAGAPPAGGPAPGAAPAAAATAAPPAAEGASAPSADAPAHACRRGSPGRNFCRNARPRGYTARRPPAGTAVRVTGFAVNKIIVIGNLGSDPEMRYTPNGQSVTSFNIASNRRYRTADGEQREETEWFRCSAFGRLADVCNQYLTRGQQVYVEGRLRDAVIRIGTASLATHWTLRSPKCRCWDAGETTNMVAEVVVTATVAATAAVRAEATSRRGTKPTICPSSRVIQTTGKLKRKRNV